MRSAALLVLCACGRLGFDARATSAGDGGDGNGGGTLDDAVVPLTCNFAARLHDDFEDNVVSAPLWAASYTNPGTSLVETGGELVLQPATNIADRYVGLKSSHMYNMRGQRHVIEVTQVTNAGAVSGTQVGPDTGDYVALVAESGNLKAVTRAPSYQLIDSIPYVPAQHRYWALREEGGTIYYETSPDAVTFTPFTSTPAPFDMSLLRIAAYAGTMNAVASPGAMHLASLGLPGSSQTACSADSLVDTFDSADETLWQNSFDGSGQTHARIGGVLEMTSNGTTNTTSVRSSAGYDLRAAAFSVQLLQDPSVPNMVAALAARLDDNNVITLAVSSTQTLARYEIGGSTTTDQMPRDSSEQWLRIREQSGNYFIEVSTDRTSWRLLRSGATGFPVDDIGAVLRLEATSPTSTDKATWDNFNAP